MDQGGSMSTGNCNDCRYGSYEGYCGKGLIMYTGMHDCSGYSAGPSAKKTRTPSPLPELPTPLRAPGCFLPIHYITNDGYEIHVPRWSTDPSTRAIEFMGIFMYGNPGLLEAIRFECLFEKDHNNQEYRCDTLGTPCRYGNCAIACPGYDVAVGRGISLGVRATRFMVYIFATLTSCHGKREVVPSRSHYDLPAEYWWLDITAPPEYLTPMHHLVMAVYTATYNPLDSKNMGRVLRKALELGLLLRGRPITDWHDAIGGLNMGLWSSKLLSDGGRLLHHWENYEYMVGDRHDQGILP